jgi:hypothetical protein
MFPLKPPSGGFHKWRYPIAGWFIIETPVKKNDLGVPTSRKPPYGCV